MRSPIVREYERSAKSAESVLNLRTLMLDGGGLAVRDSGIGLGVSEVGEKIHQYEDD